MSDLWKVEEDISKEKAIQLIEEIFTLGRFVKPISGKLIEVDTAGFMKVVTPIINNIKEV